MSCWALKRALSSAGGRGLGIEGAATLLEVPGVLREVLHCDGLGAGGHPDGGHWLSDASGPGFGGLCSQQQQKEGYPSQAVFFSALGGWFMGLSPAHGGRSAKIQILLKLQLVNRKKAIIGAYQEFAW